MRWPSKAINRLSLIGTVSAYLAGMGVLSLLAWAARDMPDPARLWEVQRPVSVQVVDRNGRDILVRGAAVAPRVRLDDLPFHVPMTFLATEDRRFYNHVGVDPIGLSRAMLTNLKAGHWRQGGSTLTQQLSKNVFLTPDKTLRRKAQEMMLSIWLERDFTKGEILEMYLSRVYFGNGAWGLEAASQTYFDKPASELAVSEAAMMAGLLRAPSKLNPRTDAKAARNRAEVILRAMQGEDLLGDGVLELALAEPLELSRPRQENSAHYFVDWIWDVVLEEIGEPTQDLVIQTTLDLDAQLAAQAAIQTHIAGERGNEALEAAAITLDGTGGVRAMIGGRDYLKSQFNRATQAQRQPGSAFKPFVYLAGLRAGLTPWTTRTDAPIMIEDWAPENFSEKFRGPVRLETALSKSINTVAVALGEEIGRDHVIATAQDFGFENLQPYRSLALGAQTTDPLTLTAAYLPFAGDGRRVSPYGILSISTADGTPLYDHMSGPGYPVLSPSERADMNRMLWLTVELGTGRRAQIPGHTIAGKTGTTNDFRDAWFVGFAPDLVTGVWVGHDDNSPMGSGRHGLTGGTLPAMIFNDVMRAQLDGRDPARLPMSSEPDWAQRQVALDDLLNDIETGIR